MNNLNKTDMAAAEAILTLCRERGPNKSICPTDAARRLAGDQSESAWRATLPRIKRAAAALAQAGIIDILRKGKPIAPADARGVLRLRLRDDADKAEGAG